MCRKREAERGGTLIEAIAALALMGLVLSALATITAQWLPNWRRGFGRIERAERIGIVLQRISADLAAAEYVPPGRDTRRPLFDGSPSAVVFVRTAIGPNAPAGLEVVRVGAGGEGEGRVTLRERARFTPLAGGRSWLEHLHFENPVRLCAAPLQLSFAYAGPDRVWKSTWRNEARLPAMMQLTMREEGRDDASVSTVAVIHAQMAGSCLSEDGQCEDGADATGGAASAPPVAGQEGQQ
ncbi:MAG: type II secretion system GspH family protein [Alphaproteobacteria bacterium]|nr:type II secretion system GspH family protein [Alphaproteobacteria bacterium]